MSEQGIYKAIPVIMAEMSAIGKDRRNGQQGYSFRGIDDVYNAMHPLLAKHGVFMLPEVVKDETEERKTKSGGLLIYRKLTVKYTICASDGSSVSCVTMGEGMDSGDKASNKAMSTAQKYAFFQVFAIPTNDPEADSESASHEVAPKAVDLSRDPDVLALMKNLMAKAADKAGEKENNRALLTQYAGDKAGIIRACQARMARLTVAEPDDVALNAAAEAGFAEGGAA